jgi:hypothetical protein
VVAEQEYRDGERDRNRESVGEAEQAAIDRVAPPDRLLPLVRELGGAGRACRTPGDGRDRLAQDRGGI